MIPNSRSDLQAEPIILYLVPAQHHGQVHVPEPTESARSTTINIALLG